MMSGTSTQDNFMFTIILACYIFITTFPHVFTIPQKLWFERKILGGLTSENNDSYIKITGLLVAHYQTFVQ